MRTILPETENPLLRQKAQEVPIDEIRGPFIQGLIKDMKELLAREKFGVAMAAAQVGDPLRLFIVSGRALSQRTEEVEKKESTDETSIPDQVYINPELIKMSRKKVDKHEGCLSIRGKWGEVPRAEKASVRAYDEQGQPFTRGASGFLAHIFQHELDHLEGVLYTDKATNVYDDEPENEQS